MDNYPEANPEANAIATEFRNECSIRCATRVLQMKQQSIYDDIHHLLRHIALLVPALERPGGTDAEPQMHLLEAALERMEDKAFANLVLQVLQRG